MPQVSSSRSGVLKATDGTRTLEMYPMIGDLAAADGELAVTEVMHRGRPMADGEGILEESQGYATAEFTLYMHDLTNAVKPAAILDWMQDTSATHVSAVPSASWTSTKTRTDNRATLDFEWYPNGTATGNQKRTLPDAMVVSVVPQEGTPNVFTVSLKSTTAHKWERVIIT